MLTALPVMVGREWVTGVIAPMTPKGACSITAKTSDFGFFHFHGAEFDTLADGDTSDDIDDLLSIFDRSLLKLFESATGCCDGLIDVIEEAGVTAGW